MENNKIWNFDLQKGQYYRMEGNTKIYQDNNARFDTNTCYTTYLTLNNIAKCDRVIKCIVDGNVNTLNKCLDVLNDHDIWSVATDDIKKIDPEMVRLILRKFDFKGYEEQDQNGVRYVVPMSYEDWEEHIVSYFPTDVQQAILKNTNLQTYLRGINNVCRYNPIILNRNMFINNHYVTLFFNRNTRL